jgi:acyl transferase domain-containing protein
MPDGQPSEVQHDLRTTLKDATLWVSGSAKAMYSNRISFFFDFKGPSPVIDTACSSSMVALDIAVTDLRLGNSSSFMRLHSKLFMIC